MKSIIKAAVATLSLLASFAYAGFPAWYPPQGFSDWGKIDEIRTNDAVLIIDDSYYRYTDDLAVHSLSQNSDSMARLRKDVKIGFIVDENSNGERFIREVWLLPDNYTQPEN